MKDLLKKEFRPSSWAIDNRISIYIFTVIITLAGLMAYQALPKENFPEIKIPKFYISVIYPGTSPANMENLVAKPLEKQLKAVSGIKKMTSQSFQDYCTVVVEFNSDFDMASAKSKVKDAVDKARTELPQDLPAEPTIFELNFSEFPIMNVNISGNYSLAQLKNYAEEVKDRVESMKEISRVDMIGALDREIQINIDMNALKATQLTMGDIERAIAFENMNISGGTVKMDGQQRTISVKGQFTSIEQLENLVVNSQAGGHIYLRDVAEIVDGFKEQESYARLDGKNVITLNVVKRAGENLISASDNIEQLIVDLKGKTVPGDLNMVITNNQADQTRVTLHDLINTIIIGFVLVLVILMFFMGATNAFFVALSVPLSMFIAFLVMPGLGFTLNMIVLFAFLLALGIVVDDAIVVIENTHRIYKQRKTGIAEAAKAAAGEVFLPVLSGTLTTLAPFVPLAFWTGMIGKFMFYLPITLIITLLASLFVAYIINPVFAVDFMGKHEDGAPKKKWTKGTKVIAIVFSSLALLFLLAGNTGLGLFTFTVLLLHLFYKFVLASVVYRFQEKTWPAVQEKYARILSAAIRKPWRIIGFTIGLFFVSIIAVALRKPDVVFFPSSDPNFIYVYVSLPVGTDPARTNEVMKEVEGRVNRVFEGKKDLITSIITNVTISVTDPADEDQGQYPNKGRLAVAFVRFSERHGVSTSPFLKDVRDALKGLPGAEITVTQEQNGPPVAKPITIEVRGEEFDVLTKASARLKRYLDSLEIAGVEQLKSDLQSNKPELVFDINRERANREGISTAQIGMEIRNAVFGKEASKYREANEEFPIQLRYRFDQRNEIDKLKNITITYRDMNMGGMIRNVPLSAFVDIYYDYTFGGIKRKSQKRVVTLSSNVLKDFDPFSVVANVEKAVKRFNAPPGVQIIMTGEQEEQAETMGFLGNALLISLGLIFMILVTQFNSFGKPFLILSEIVLSIIGFCLGYAITGWTISTIMAGVGIVALAGIVVRNGILLVEFTDVLRAEGREITAAVVEAGKTRMTPVILTATATILGLIPLAVGFNIDFASLFSTGDPKIFFGGDSVAFWGPLSWTMIFGLGFATIITLIIVPALYLIMESGKQKAIATLTHFGMPGGLRYVPLLVPVLRIFKK
ncbi:MAG: efflux RND transporter permease subunit [Bacteroidia bacterium]|nr:efflux RND transporter permease subunit [Bacteroidia bacterium]